MTWQPGCGTRWTPLEGRPHFASVEACELEEWTLAFWKRDRSQAPLVTPMLCGSWRCRRCARWRGALDWVRVSKGVTSRKWWLYCVITFDPREFTDKWDAFRKAGEKWDHGLRRAIERQIESFCEQLFTPENDRLCYVQTWERHANGWPHVNVLLSSDRLQALVEAWGVERRKHGKTGRTCAFPKRWRKWLRDRAMAAGFGRSIWVEVIDDEHGADAMTSYLLKLAKELTGAPSKKGGQSPIDAPKHFRRIRASHKLLPPHAKSSGEWTGALLMEPIAVNLREELKLEAAGIRGAGQKAELEVTFDQVDAWLRRQARQQAGEWCAPSAEVDRLLHADGFQRALRRNVPTLAELFQEITCNSLRQAPQSEP